MELTIYFHEQAIGSSVRHTLTIHKYPCSGFEGNITIGFQSDANIYGRYTDPYLVNDDQLKVNPYEMDLTKDNVYVEADTPKKGDYHII